MLVVFSLSVLFCLYTYVLFPLVLALLARRRPAPGTASAPEVWPEVSIIIAAHNEQQYLQQKIESLRALDYPADRLQLLLVSDGSTDDTVAVLDSAGLDYEHYTPARGKPTALNRGLARATAEFVVFMDARQTVSPNALKALISRFADPEVAVVSGELILCDSDNVESDNVGLYWRYEKWIRQNESRLFSTTGATGALYAVRRADVPELAADALLDDFEIPIHSLAGGRRTVFEPAAIVREVRQSSAEDEFRRKVRTLAGNFQAFARHRWLFHPLKNPVFWQFVSHKVFRLLVPLAMLLALLSSALGQGALLQSMFLLQLLFYGIGLLGILRPQLSGNRLISLIGVFLQLNLAVVVGAYRYYSGSYNVQWKAGL